MSPMEIAKQKFLISNDDGVSAAGIEALASAVSSLGDVTVIAPQSNCSGFSSALTLERPLHPTTLDNGYISVNGTPADCVHLGINGYLKSEFDMVVSGINAGANLGDDVLYSGTVAAAIEGRFLGKPALAVSLVNGKDDSDYQPAARIAVELIKQWEQLSLSSRSMVNVNVPHLPLNEIKGIKVTRLGHRQRSQDVVQYRDPRGKCGYWLGIAGDMEDTGPDTDFHAVSNGYVSVTPIQPDMTHFQELDQLRSWVDSFTIQFQ